MNSGYPSDCLRANRRNNRQLYTILSALNVWNKPIFPVT